MGDPVARQVALRHVSPLEVEIRSWMARLRPATRDPNAWPIAPGRKSRFDEVEVAAGVPNRTDSSTLAGERLHMRCPPIADGSLLTRSSAAKAAHTRRGAWTLDDKPVLRDGAPLNIWLGRGHGSRRMNQMRGPPLGASASSTTRNPNVS